MVWNLTLIVVMSAFFHSQNRLKNHHEDRGIIIVIRNEQFYKM